MFETNLLMQCLLSLATGMVFIAAYFWIKKDWWPKKLSRIADDSDIEYALEYAESKGKKALALELLRKVRMEHGNNSVRLCHTLWIQDVVDESTLFPEDGKTPSFKTIEDVKKHLNNPDAH